MLSGTSGPRVECIVEHMEQLPPLWRVNMSSKHHLPIADLTPLFLLFLLDDELLHPGPIAATSRFPFFEATVV